MNSNQIVIDMKRIDIFLGYSCNNNCIFCCVADKRNKVMEKSTNEVKSDLLMAKNENIKEVHFVGGEPTIRRDIIELVSYSKELGFKKIKITTNGRKFYYENFTKEIISAGLNNIIFSVHGPNSELHDYLTRTPGSFNQLLKGMKNVQEYDVICESNTTIVKQNYEYLPKIVELLSQFRINSMELIYFHPRGNAFKNFKKLHVSINNILPYIKRAIQIGENNNILVLSRYIPFCFMKGYEKYLSEIFEPQEIIHKAPEFIDMDVIASRKNIAAIKSPKCRECKYDLICMGLYKEHKNELKNINPIPGKKILSIGDIIYGN